METKNIDQTSNWSDDQICESFRKFGRITLEGRQKCIGLLPEINRRQLFEKMGFDSIFECAAKLAGLSREQVFLALNLEKRFEDKPSLKAALTNGVVSINKLTRVVSVATVENEEKLAEQVMLLSKSAVETLVRDIRFEAKKSSNSIEESEIQNGLFKTKNEAKGLPGQTIKLSAEVTDKLFQLQRKGFDINELLLDLLEKREEAIAAEKAEVAAEMCEKAIAAKKEGKKIPRHQPAKVEKILQQEFGTKCAVPNCNRLAEEIHHTDRHGMSGQHNPYYMAPLCREHHQIAHSIDVKVQEKRREALRS